MQSACVSPLLRKPYFPCRFRQTTVGLATLPARQSAIACIRPPSPEHSWCGGRSQFQFPSDCLKSLLQNVDQEWCTGSPQSLGGEPFRTSRCTLSRYYTLRPRRTSKSQCRPNHRPSRGSPQCAFWLPLASPNASHTLAPGQGQYANASHHTWEGVVGRHLDRP